MQTDGTHDGRIADGGEEEGGDTFYPRLLEIADAVGAKVLMFEVGGMAQARRVAGMVGGRGWGEGGGGVEIWRDWVGFEGGGVEGEEVLDVGLGGKDMVRVRGRGNGRGVFAWRGGGKGLVGGR